MIDVLNRGMGGQEAPIDELARFEPDVIGEAPALVIWQVGTNAVFRKEEIQFRRRRRIDRNRSRLVAQVFRPTWC